MTTDSQRELIAEGRKSRNLSSDNLLSNNENVRNFLSGLDIKEELPIVLS